MAVAERAGAGGGVRADVAPVVREAQKRSQSSGRSRRDDRKGVKLDASSGTPLGAGTLGLHETDRKQGSPRYASLDYSEHEIPASSESEIRARIEARKAAEAKDKAQNGPRRKGRRRGRPILGVRFRRAGKIYYFDARGREQVRLGDAVIVDTARGEELGRVVIAPDQVVDRRGIGRLKPISRVASWKDLADQARMRLSEREALGHARQLAQNLDLPILAAFAEYNFDGSRLTLFYTSEEQQVNCRSLARDLAGRLHTRVHLRQIGPRDRAKQIGGIDRCGRELCCSSWMPEFMPIQIRMAKNQQLPLNPTEISGVCGKLLCCLSFEDDQYNEMKAGMPKLGARLTSAVGRGRIVDINMLTRLITIQWETGTRVTVSADEFAEQQARKERAFGPA